MIIAITNQKGGVGKTTLSINLSSALAQLGNRVLLVDMDPQGNASDGLGIDTNSLEHTVYETLVHDRPISEIVIPHARENLFIAPSDISLSGAESDLATDISRPFRLRKALRAEQAKYDFIIIDCPPSLGILTVNALLASTDLLVPIEPNSYALKGMSMLMTTILKIQDDLDHFSNFLGVVVNMYNPDIPLHGSIVYNVNEYFTPKKVFQTRIYRNPLIPEAEIHGKSVLEYCPDNGAATLFLELAREVMERRHD